MQESHLHFLSVRASDDTEALPPLCETELGTDCNNLEEVITESLEHIGLRPRFAKRKGQGFLSSVSPVHRELANDSEEKTLASLSFLMTESLVGEGTQSRKCGQSREAF